jgi:prevent-host-death family protein
MCYMARTRAALKRSNQVGVRELRQNLSVYLARVQKGEALSVTDRGRVVAMLAPLPKDATPIEQLIASGRATPGVGDVLSLGPPRGRPSNRFSRLLIAMRDEERY